ncbi:MAG TPA: CRISPR-associated endonuclease Cas2 [Thermoanaerobaculia bacterium]
MMVVVSYDVSTIKPAGKRRLRRVAKVCLDYGQRVQNSVFECVVDPTEWTQLRHRLLQAYDETEDSLRFYFLGRHWKGRIEHFGIKTVLDLDEPLIA